MKTIERIKEFIEFKGVSYNSFDKLIEASNGYIGKQIKNSASVGSDVIEKIISIYPDINVEWLLTGNGQMIKIAENYADTLPAKHQFEDHSGEYTTHTPGAKSGAKTGNTQKGVQPTVQPTKILSPQIIGYDTNDNEVIPFVAARAAAGYTNGYGDPEFMETLPAYQIPELQNATYRAFEVDGDSMFPTLSNKQRVFGRWIEGTDYIREDQVHVLVLKSGIIIKRLLNRIDKYGYIVAKSDAFDDRNQYPNREVYPDEILEIWYCVAHFSFTFKHPGDMYKRVNNIEADLTEVMRLLKANKLLG